MVHTENSIDIAADPELVFALAARIERWPAMLSHYRYVRVEPALAGDGPAGRTVRAGMSASRSGIPVRWFSVQIVDPVTSTITYRHIRGITQGMEVLWRVEPADGGTLATILHELNSPGRLLRAPGAEAIAARLFVSSIADRTLAGIKRVAEAAQGVPVSR